MPAHTPPGLLRWADRRTRYRSRRYGTAGTGRTPRAAGQVGLPGTPDGRRPPPTRRRSTWTCRIGLWAGYDWRARPSPGGLPAGRRHRRTDWGDCVQTWNGEIYRRPVPSFAFTRETQHVHIPILPGVRRRVRFPGGSPDSGRLRTPE